MVLLSGKLSNTILFLLYASATVFLIIEKNFNNYEVQLFQAKSFLDCAVDNDDDKHTCFSAYVLIKSVIAPVHILMITIFCIATVCRIGILIVHQNHSLNIFSYVDNIFTNTLVLFVICIVGGIQEVKFLSLITTAVFCVELLYTYHDFFIDSEITTKLYITIWICQCVVWSVIVISTTFYISNSYQLPIFIPCFVYFGLGFNLLYRFFHARFFYHLVPKKLGYDIVETIQSIQNQEPLYLDWFNSWTNILIFIQRSLLFLFYVLLTKNFKITYV